MYGKLVITLAISFVVAQVVCDSQPSPQQSPQRSTPGAVAAARKIRLLTMNPGVIKLYRMLGASGLRQSLDDEDLISDDESYFQKRQYDDYGHMRFGKRNPKDFDDYGHMRFGK